MRHGKLEAVCQRVECRLWPAFSHPTETQHLAFRWFSEILKPRIGMVLRFKPSGSSLLMAFFYGRKSSPQKWRKNAEAVRSQTD